MFIDCGGDNLAATFSPDLADLTLYVISVCQGEKIPRKGGPAIARSDLLVINKTDLAPHVGADLAVMKADAEQVRGIRPFVFTDLLRRIGVDEVMRFHRAGRRSQGRRMQDFEDVFVILVIQRRLWLERA